MDTQTSIRANLRKHVYAYTRIREGVVRMSWSNSVRRLLHSARVGAAVIATAIAGPVMAVESAAITADHVRLVDQCDTLESAISPASIAATPQMNRLSPISRHSYVTVFQESLKFHQLDAVLDVCSRSTLVRYPKQPDTVWTRPQAEHAGSFGCTRDGESALHKHVDSHASMHS